jgi:hypothetical protein
MALAPTSPATISVQRWRRGIGVSRSEQAPLPRQGLVGCPEPITVSPGRGETCLIEQRKNSQDLPLPTESLAFLKAAVK